MSKLSAAEISILNHGDRNKHGIISKPMKMSNFDKPERRMAKLVAAGLVTPSPHGDWYITETAKKILAAGRAHIAALARKDGEDQFAREVEAGAWDHRDDVAAAIARAAMQLAN